MNIKQEQLWIKRIKKKDEDALFELIQNYGPWVKAIIRKKLIYFPQEQEECFNDTFLKAWEQIDKYNPSKGSLQNWIGAIAVYVSIDIYRKCSKLLDEVPLRDDDISKEDAPEAILIKREYEEQLLTLLDELKESDKELFIQLFFNGKSYDEMAAELGVKKEYLYNRISRGRKNLFKSKEELL
ncbi:MAG: sigma-70 family RNA polymerase sigma factor [Tissierellia bacterium]|nr:sigma-70 family RNA polymerase sigma factor [Tissierellia bacterium]